MNDTVKTAIYLFWAMAVTIALAGGVVALGFFVSVWAVPIAVPFACALLVLLVGPVLEWCIR